MKYLLADKLTEVKFSSIDDLPIIEQDNSFFVVDNNITRLYPDLCCKLQDQFQYPAIEENKSLSYAEKLLTWLRSSGANRESNLIAIGGGITSDITAWVAANYMRGCNLIIIPTTLVAMIDAALGGKTALNFAGSKNLIGTFYPASQVVIDINFLNTLSEDQMLAGKAEMIKTALLQRGDLLKIAGSDQIYDMIKSAVKFKMEICARDPYDNNVRRSLNLGHTYAHVIESALNYKINHGRAVAIGIAAAAELSLILNKIDSSRYQEIMELMTQNFSDAYLTLNKQEYEIIRNTGEEYFKNDKKAGKASRVVLFDNEKITDIVEGLSWFDLLKTIKTY